MIGCAAGYLALTLACAMLLTTADYDAIESPTSIEKKSFFHAEGRLEDWEQEPPPVTKAINENKSVWCLLDLEEGSDFPGGSKRMCLYAIFDHERPPFPTQQLCTIVEKHQINLWPKNSGKYNYSWVLWNANEPIETPGDITTTNVWQGHCYRGGNFSLTNKIIHKTKGTGILAPPSSTIVEITHTITASIRGWTESIDNIHNWTTMIDDDIATAIHKESRRRSDGVVTKVSDDGKVANIITTKYSSSSGAVRRLK